MNSAAETTFRSKDSDQLRAYLLLCNAGNVIFASYSVARPTSTLPVVTVPGSQTTGSLGVVRLSRGDRAVLLVVIADDVVSE